MYRNDWEEYRAMLCSEENRPFWIITPLMLISLTVAGILFNRYTPMDATYSEHIPYRHNTIQKKEIVKTRHYRYVHREKKRRTFWNMTLRNLKRMYPIEGQRATNEVKKRRRKVRIRRNTRARVMRRRVFTRMNFHSSYYRSKMLRMAAQVVALKSTNMFPDLSDTALGAQVR